jgi:hypothetical protein
VCRTALVNFTVTNALPTSWFLGLFEWIRGSDRWYVRSLAARAAIGTAAALAAAALTSIVGFHGQMQRALAASADTGGGGGARVPRWMARRLAGRAAVAAATADFALLTLARNRAQQTPIAMNAAVGVAIVLAALMQVHQFSALAQPRTVVLWIPLVLAYWAIVGLRAAFFVPADVPAAWIFRVCAPACESRRWSAVRAVLMTCVLPPIAAISLLVTALPLGSAVAVAHTAFVCAIATVMIELAALTVRFVPFSRAYEPGRAKLRTRWWLYVLGIYASAAWPVRFEIWALLHPAALASAIAGLAAVTVALEFIGRRQAIRLAPTLPEDTADEAAGFTVLDIGLLVHGASRT